MCASLVLEVLELRIYTVDQHQPARRLALPTSPSWVPTTEEWRRPDNVLRVMMRENGHDLGYKREVDYLPSAAARVRCRTLSRSVPPTMFLPHMDAPGSGEC